MNKANLLSRALTLTATALLIASLKLPLWKMNMDAPQYQGEDQLQVAIYPNRMKGDLGEIATLNQYIGVHVPNDLPQLKWLPGAIMAGASLALAAVGFRPRGRRMLTAASATLVLLALLTAAGMAQWQMHQIGHQRTQKTALVGVENFTPPLLGRIKVANFRLTSQLGLGAYAIGIALVLQLGLIRFPWSCTKPAGLCRCRTIEPMTDAQNREEVHA